jgi:hypothetical protein
MRHVVALVLASLAASPALADTGCEGGYGSPDVFKFVSWKFTRVEGEWVEIKLTFHNNLKQNIKQAHIVAFVDGKHLPIRSKELANAASDAVAVDEVGMPAEDVARFPSLTPQLCVEWTYDENDTRKSYVN